MTLRSLLFSPGSRPDMMAKAKRSGADGLIFDLEDAVAPGARAAAREVVATALAGAGLSDAAPSDAAPSDAAPSDAALSDSPGPVFVRVNHPSTGEMERDLDAVVSAGPAGIVLPKVETAAEVAGLDEALRVREGRADRRPGSIVILPLVESCRGLHFAYDIARASSRVAGLAFSSGEEGDFMADLQGQWTPAGEAMLYPRSKLVCETRAAGLDWPVDGVCMQLDDEAALLGECRLARRLGYTAKLAIHPSQVATIHGVFTPTAEEIAYSEGLVAAFQEARAAGVGAFRYQGRMVDKANVRRAEQFLARATVARASPSPPSAERDEIAGGSDTDLQKRHAQRFGTTGDAT